MKLKIYAIRLILLIFFFIIFCLSFTFAKETGNPRKGKYLYRKNCLFCHKYGTDNQLSPNSKTMEQWKAAFKKEKIKTYPCAKAHWSKLSEGDILDIFTHMYSHASDSPQPASCK
jgi:hypothetical protein